MPHGLAVETDGHLLCAVDGQMGEDDALAIAKSEALLEASRYRGDWTITINGEPYVPASDDTTEGSDRP